MHLIGPVKVTFTSADDGTVVRSVYDAAQGDARRLIGRIEAYGAALTDPKRQSALRRAAMEVGRDRAAIRRCIDIIMAAIGDAGLSP